MFRILLLLCFMLPTVMGAQGIVTGDTLSAVTVYKNIKDTEIVAYTNTGPHSADFDLDGDNINDIQFTAQYNMSPGGNWSSQKVFSLNNIEIATLTTPAGCAANMLLNTTIDQSLNWSNATAGILLFSWSASSSGSSTTGVLIGANKYLAFRKKVATDTVYGWISIDNGYQQATIRSWAYKVKMAMDGPEVATSPEAVGMARLSEKTASIELFPNPATDELKIIYEGYNIKEIKVMNLLGEVVLNRKTDPRSEKLSLITSEFKSGVYVIELSTDSRIVTKKFIKE